MLNEKQEIAATSKSKRILCLAGAGTGKTKTLIERVKNILNSGVKPENILCLTFTRMAGLEMKSRLGEVGNKIFINTFHSFCSKVIRENLNYFGLKDNFTIYDQKQREEAIKVITQDLKMTKENIKLDIILDCIFNQKKDTIKHKRAEIIAKEYRSFLRNNNATDIDLLITDVVQAFKNEEFKQKYHNIYKYIFVDEFQDTNSNQFQFIESINPEYLFLVGDDYQAIYGFAGAKVQYILDIANNPEYEVIRLEQNYRSTKQIIDAANKLITHNESRTEKTLISETDGEKIEKYKCRNFDKEIINAISIIKKDNLYNNYCIMARTNNLINKAKDILLENKIPFRVLGEKVPTLENEETKMLIQLIELINNPINDILFISILNKLINNDICEKIQINAINNDLSVYEELMENGDKYNENINKIFDFIEDISLEDTDNNAFNFLFMLLQKEFIITNFNQQNLNELIHFVELWEKTQNSLNESCSINEFINWFKTKDDSDVELVLKTEKGEGVVLTTAHSSKGLEFDNVFLVGMNQNIFPHKRGDIEEERRLCFVAITRAKKKLIISFSTEEVETWSGKVKEIKPSQFIQEIK